MLDLHTERFAEGVDARKPVLYARKKLDRASAGNKIVPAEADALFAALLDHRVHIGEQTVHAVFIAEAVGDAPELARRVAEGGNEAVVLHIGGAEGLIKVVKKGDDGLFVHIGSFLPQARPKKMKKAAFFESRLLFVYSSRR